MRGLFTLCDHGAVKSKNLPPESTQSRRAPFHAAAIHFDERLAKGMIHDFNQRPCPHVGHVQALRAFGDRTVDLNRGQEVCFAWAKCDFTLMKNTRSKLQGGAGLWGLGPGWPRRGHFKTLAKGLLGRRCFHKKISYVFQRALT